jgi:hypothetical protein
MSNSCLPEPIGLGYESQLCATRALKDGRLSVEVMEPNDPASYNRGVRFSPAANVLRANFDGREFLFSPVEHDPFSENGGLAMEFDLMTPEEPPGFAEAEDGGGFLKLGVGVLKKVGMKYSFWAQYEMIAPAETYVKWGTSEAFFTQMCDGVNGYSYHLDSTVRVRENIVEINYKLVNTGTKSFITEQYAHNYFCFDGLPVGPGYSVEFPYDYKAGGLQAEQKQEGSKIRFLRGIPCAVNIDVRPPLGYNGLNTLLVSHSNGMKADVKTSVPGPRTAIHASEKYLCPEQFVRFFLLTGESKEWSRIYEFGVSAIH